MPVKSFHIFCLCLLLLVCVCVCTCEFYYFLLWMRFRACQAPASIEHTVMCGLFDLLLYDSNELLNYYARNHFTISTFGGYNIFVRLLNSPLARVKTVAAAARHGVMASMINRRFVCWLFIWFAVRFAYKLHVRTSRNHKTRRSWVHDRGFEFRLEPVWHGEH